MNRRKLHLHRNKLEKNRGKGKRKQGKRNNVNRSDNPFAPFIQDPLRPTV